MDEKMDNEVFLLQATPRINLFVQCLRDEELGVAPPCSATFDVHAVAILHEHWR